MGFVLVKTVVIYIHQLDEHFNRDEKWFQLLFGY